MRFLEATTRPVRLTAAGAALFLLVACPRAFPSSPPPFTLDAGSVMGFPGEATVIVLVFSNNPGAPARDVSWHAEFAPGTTPCTFTGPSKGTVHLAVRSRVEVDLGVEIPASVPSFYECCGVTLTASEPGGGPVLATATVDLCPAATTPTVLDPADRIPYLYWVQPWRGIPADDARRFDAVLANETNNSKTYSYRIDALPLDGAPLFLINGKADAVVDSVRLGPGATQAVTLLVGAPEGVDDGSRNEIRLSVTLGGIPLQVSAFALAGDFATAALPATWGRIKSLYGAVSPGATSRPSRPTWHPPASPR